MHIGAQGITAHFRPGVLTALMGGTGAGKTTLMDVVAGRKTQGIITGDILVNGTPCVTLALLTTNVVRRST